MEYSMGLILIGLLTVIVCIACLAKIGTENQDRDPDSMIIEIDKNPIIPEEVLTSYTD